MMCRLRPGPGQPRTMKGAHEHTPTPIDSPGAISGALAAAAGDRRRHLLLPWFHRPASGGTDRRLRQLAAVPAPAAPGRRQALAGGVRRRSVHLAGTERALLPGPFLLLLEGLRLSAPDAVGQPRWRAPTHPARRLALCRRMAVDPVARLPEPPPRHRRDH